MRNYKVTLIKSPIGTSRRVRSALEALGLKRVGKSKVLTDSPQFRGNVLLVQHLVSLDLKN